ncbi:H-X9-DG-CTERM domain-containing protein [Streptomyces sp. NPDC005727]
MVHLRFPGGFHIVMGDGSHPSHPSRRFRPR